MQKERQLSRIEEEGEDTGSNTDGMIFDHLSLQHDCTSAGLCYVDLDWVVILCLKVLGKSVGLCKTTKDKRSIVHQFTCSVWRIICENFNPNRLILAEIWMKI